MNENAIMLLRKFNSIRENYNKLYFIPCTIIIEKESKSGLSIKTINCSQARQEELTGLSISPGAIIKSRNMLLNNGPLIKKEITTEVPSSINHQVKAIAFIYRSVCDKKTSDVQSRNRKKFCDRSEWGKLNSRSFQQVQIFRPYRQRK